MADRKRLPVLQEPRAAAPEPPTEDDARPPWQWVGFGVVAIFAVWLPLAYAAQAITARVLSGRFGDAAPAEIGERLAQMTGGERMRLTATMALPHVLALALASFAGGLLVGRFGARTGVREAALAGGSAALVALALSVSQAGFSWPSGIALAFAVGFAAWGGRTGVALRARA